MKDEKSSSRPRFQRAETPPTMRFQERDGEVLRAIYQYDGVLARRHLKAIFWPDKTWRAMEMRLSLLYHQGYLDWPDAEQRQTKPIPEPICWLGWKGALWLAGDYGVQIEPPKSTNQSQRRLLERKLREQGIRWLCEPHWIQLTHDLAVVDFRLAVEKAVKALPTLTLETWITESVFHAHMDVIKYPLSGQDGKVRRVKKGVRPDGYFVILDQKRLSEGLPARARFLVELDLATHDNPSFGREKVLPGLAYLKSTAYKTRFGANTGRWLVVTTGPIRMKHLLQQTAETVGSEAGAFFFSTLNQVLSENPLTAYIWRQVGEKKPFSLLTV